MGIKYSFIDSEVYGTDDINDITRSLTGAGVAPFVSKSSYNTTDLNTLTAALVGSGVQLEGCLCSAFDVGTTQMSVSVAQGIVFFESGVRLVVDGAGYTVSVTPNTAGYIYAHYSSSLQKADIVFERGLPSNGEYVLLAEVLADGTILDKRTFAKSKIATLGRNVFSSKIFVNIDPVLIRTEGKFEYYKVANVQGADLSKFNYAIVSVDGALSERALFATTFYDIVNKKGIFSVSSGGSASSGNAIDVVSHYSLSGQVEICNNELCIVAKCSISNNGAENLYLFEKHKCYAKFV